MGEIKSTLDLVMERTRHLTLTDAEKQEQHEKEFKQNFNGLLEKFKTQSLRMESFEKSLAQLRETFDIQDDQKIILELTDRLRFDQDNNWLFTLLKEVCHADTAALESLFASYQDEVGTLLEKGTALLKKTFKKQHRISGSAVAPNPWANKEWLHESHQLKASYQERLEKESNPM